MAALELIDTTLYTDANLVSYWRLDGNSSDRRDANGGTDTDITYNTSNGKFGQGAGFNGTTSLISIADATNLKITTAFSLLAWIKTSTAGPIQIYQSYSQNTNVAGMFFQNAGTKIRFLTGKNSGTSQGTDYQLIDGGTTINDGNWHLIVCVWDGANLRLYVDGASDATAVAWANAPAYAATNYIRIGVRVNSGSNVALFNGSIDDVAVFSRALSATEISNHWNGLNARTKSFMSIPRRKRVTGSIV